MRNAVSLSIGSAYGGGVTASTSDSAAVVADLHTERLLLRAWTAVEAGTVTEGGRLGDWVEDFPDEGDKAIAPLIAAEPAWLGPFGHRLMIERESGLVVGSLGLFWPPSDGGWSWVTASRLRGAASATHRRRCGRWPNTRSPRRRSKRCSRMSSRRIRPRCGVKAGFIRTATGSEQGTDRYDAPHPDPSI